MAEEPQNPAARVGNRGADWLRPIRAVSIAFDVRKVFLAAVGLAIVQAGWLNLERISPGAMPANQVFNSSDILFQRLPEPTALFDEWLPRVAEPVIVLIAPMSEFLQAETKIGDAAVAFLKFALVVVVFGIVGGAIARSAVVEVARGERLSLAESLRFAFRRGGSLIGAPSLPMLGVMLCGLVAAVFGLLDCLPDGVSEVAGGIGFIVPVALGFASALLLIDLAASWPLMHAAVAAEDEDSIDALTRAFGCVNRRPVQFIALVALVLLVGSAGLIVTVVVANMTLQLAAWGTSFTAAGVSPIPSRTWFAIVAFIIQSWVYAYFWSAAALIYLTLRRDIDGAPWSEVADA